MKIIKTFEDFDISGQYKKYIVWKLGENDFQFHKKDKILYIILELVSHKNILIKFKKLYFKTFNIIQKFDENEKLPFETNVEYFKANKKNENFIYQTDNLSDALEYVEIYDKSKKYNI